MNTKEAKATVKTGHTNAQIKDAKNALNGIGTNEGKIIHFYRAAYVFNRLTAKSDNADFTKVNSACYLELGVSEKIDAKKYNTAKVLASRAKAEIRPSVKAKAKKKVVAPVKNELVTTPAEEQVAMHVNNPKDCVLNLATSLVRDAKMKAIDLELYFSKSIVEELKKRKIVK